MTYPVVILPEVEDAVRRMAQWWAEHHSPREAEVWFNGVYDAFYELEDNARRFPLARENDQFPCDVRVMNYGVGSRPTHRVLYTIRPDAVVVISIRAAKQKDATPDDL